MLAGVAAASLPMLSPALWLAATARSSVAWLLAPSVSALTAALVPMAAAAFLLPGPGSAAVALLLPLPLAFPARALSGRTVRLAPLRHRSDLGGAGTCSSPAIISRC